MRFEVPHRPNHPPDGSQCARMGCTHQTVSGIDNRVSEDMAERAKRRR